MNKVRATVMDWTADASSGAVRKEVGLSVDSTVARLMQLITYACGVCGVSLLIW